MRSVRCLLNTSSNKLTEMACKIKRKVKAAISAGKSLQCDVL